MLCPGFSLYAMSPLPAYKSTIHPWHSLEVAVSAACQRLGHAVDAASKTVIQVWTDKSGQKSQNPLLCTSNLDAIRYGKEFAEHRTR